ncbi:MAG: transcriptional repressor [Kiritimatiellaeota bacterium]|nr:transcriptional repressor [Kiritimatiellota bacterium]
MMNAEIVQLLVSHGIRASLQRIAVMTYLLKNQRHPTAEMVYSALHPKFPTLSRSTVYQALDLFCEKGAAQKIVMGEGEMRFEADISIHGHFLCRKCSTIFNFFYPGDTELPAAPKDFHVEHRYLYYQGICPSCAT